MITAFTFGGMDDVEDPMSVGSPDPTARRADMSYNQCTDIADCFVTNNQVLVRRDGYALTTAGNITSAWSNGVDSFIVMNRLLHNFDGTYVNLIGNSPAVLPAVEFCQVNTVTAFSDTNTIGVLQDGVPYVTTNPAEAVDLLDLPLWVKLTYPAGFEAEDSNFDRDAFRIATYAGRCLEFFNGALYLAASLVQPDGQIVHFVFCSTTFNIERMDPRYNVVAGFPSPVTMIKAVTDGLFIGTEGGTYFLAGDGVKGSAPGVSGFSQRKLLPFGVVYGSAQAVHADKVAPARVKEIGAVWLTSDGIYAGGAGGTITNLSAGRKVIPAGTRAAAQVWNNGADWQYTVTVETITDSDSETVEHTTITVNLATADICRFSNYPFTSYFQRGAVRYGCNASGVHALSGNTDKGAAIIGGLTTPLVDFGVQQKKACANAYLQVRTAGEMLLDLYVDGVLLGEAIPFVSDDTQVSKVRRMRAKLPLGVRGYAWQFRVYSADGTAFTAYRLDTTPTQLQRTT